VFQYQSLDVNYQVNLSILINILKEKWKDIWRFLEGNFVEKKEISGYGGNYFFGSGNTVPHQ
jgi:hypothetical protein